MKNICIIDYDISVCGGVERVSSALANALADHYRVHLLSLCMKDEQPAFELDERVIFKAFLKKEDRLRYMRRDLKPLVRAYFRENGIDTAILQETHVGFLISTTCAGCGTRLIFSDHSSILSQWEGRPDMRFIRWIDSRKTSMTVVLTDQSRAAYKEKLRQPDKKLTRIYNWIDPDIPVSQKYDLTSKRIISAGRLGHEKGFDLLIKAFAPVAAKHPDWHLDIFGDGEMEDTVRGLIEEFGIGDNVHLCGTVSDLDRRYGEYAMYVLPSFREGLPLVLLEAKANRLPIVSFDIQTGPREIFTDQVSGLLVEPYDTDRMAEAINSLIEDDEKRKSMSDHSQDDIDRFSKDEILKQWIALIG